MEVSRKDPSGREAIGVAIRQARCCHCRGDARLLVARMRMRRPHLADLGVESDGSGQLRVWQSKPCSGQVLYLGALTAQLIRSWLAARGEVDGNDTPLFCRVRPGGHRTSDALKVGSIREVVKQRAAKASCGEGRVNGVRRHRD